MGKDPAFLRKRFLKYVFKHWCLNNHNLEEISAVYLMIAFKDYRLKDADIVYIGSSTNLFLRYKSHKIPSKIQSTGNMNLMYYLPMKRSFYDYEIKLISKLKPIYNTQHK